jgi:hypothetical protein
MARKRQTHREFVLTEPSPPITAREYPEFYALYQRAIFAALERRGLLTPAQRDSAFTEIDKIPRKSG